MSTVTANIKSIRDIMRKDTGVDGDAQRISQMVWMLFMKIFADKEEEWELVLDDYESPIPDKLKWQNWASDDEGLTGDNLMEFINNELFPTLKDLDISHSPQAKIIRAVFDDTYNYMKNGTLFRQVINEIDKIDFNSTEERHLFNDIYETILKELQSAGSAGEYYTPRGVTQFMVDIINPQLGESVFDMACGTGGFLTCSIEHLRNQVKTAQDRDVLQKSIRGIEKKPLPHLLCTTNLMLHGFDLPAVRRDNLLNKPYADWGRDDRVDVVLMNPPFGGIEEDGTETNFPAKFRTKETADLFLALIIKMLKDGGRCAVVVPDGTLFGEGVKTRIKEELMDKCNLHTIVRLPNGVFNPYTGIKTNLLFFDKGTPTKDVWYYEHPYPEGYKSYNKSKPITVKEFDAEKSWWNNREENKYAWKVSVDEIKERGYNLDIKNPHQEADDIASPNEIEATLEKADNSINVTRDKISSIISDVLEDTYLLKHFNRLLQHKSNVNDLRNGILQLAVQGKLTAKWRANTSNIEPASELLKRIEAEKQQLIKEKKIKKESPLPIIGEDEIPYELPDGWVWCRLINLNYDLHYGYTASAKSTYNGVGLLRITDIQNNKVNWQTVPDCDIKDKDLPKYLLSDNDILIARTGGTIGKSYLVKGVNRQAVFASYLIRAIPVKDVNADYIKLFIESPLYWGQLYANSQGTGQPNVNATSLKGLITPLPPLEEQKAIVEKVNSLMTLCDELEQQIETSHTQVEQLMQSCLKEVFEV